jgi:hypothetical protein
VAWFSADHGMFKARINAPAGVTSVAFESPPEGYIAVPSEIDFAVTIGALTTITADPKDVTPPVLLLPPDRVVEATSRAGAEVAKRPRCSRQRGNTASPCGRS